MLALKDARALLPISLGTCSATTFANYRSGAFQSEVIATPFDFFRHHPTGTSCDKENIFYFRNRFDSIRTAGGCDPIWEYPRVADQQRSLRVDNSGE